MTQAEVDKRVKTDLEKCAPGLILQQSENKERWHEIVGTPKWATKAIEYLSKIHYT